MTTMHAPKLLGGYVLSVAGVLLLCSTMAYAWPWSKDMSEQPSIKPQEAPRLPPVHSVPTQGKEPKMDRLKAGRELKNPVKPTAASVGNGKQLFDIYCTACHGADAKGNGPVAKKFVPPPDLTLEAIRKRPDGFIYEQITSGGPIMPGQGEALRPRERWEIVNYLRTL
ncbi:MAG TPA: c-type cytochrome, partial [Terriglobales bacterium]|nr:c-type cytochrome [Terriglobales bacterium]